MKIIIFFLFCYIVSLLLIYVAILNNIIFDSIKTNRKVIGVLIRLLKEITKRCFIVSIILYIPIYLYVQYISSELFLVIVAVMVSSSLDMFIKSDYSNI